MTHLCSTVYIANYVYIYYNNKESSNIYSTKQ